MAEWTDPRPNLPPSDAVVMLKCSDGSTRYGAHNRYEGWKDGFPALRPWSAAHPTVVGWKRAHWPPTTEEEFSAASRGMDPQRIEQWRKALSQLPGCAIAGVDTSDGGHKK